MKKMTKVIVLALSLSLISTTTLFAQEKKVVKKDEKAKKEVCCDHDHAKVEHKKEAKSSCCDTGKTSAKSSCCDTDKAKTTKTTAKVETTKKK